tara:strand:+ start:201 stop:518 length:318 start_codon:yes stop_codon:yes gene_type:complete
MPRSKSSGVKDRSTDTIHIGTSASNSHPFITRVLEINRKENGDIVYTAFVDLKPEETSFGLAIGKGCAGSIILRQCTLVKETGEMVYDTYPPIEIKEYLLKGENL